MNEFIGFLTKSRPGAKRLFALEIRKVNRFTLFKCFEEGHSLPKILFGDIFIKFVFSQTNRIVSFGCEF